MRTIIILIFILILCSPGWAPTHYLDTAASGNNDGTSWADAFETLDDAMDVNSGGVDCTVEEGDIIEVNDGSYGDFTEDRRDGAAWMFYRDDWIIYRATAGASPDFNSITVYDANIAAGGTEYGRSYLHFEGITIADGVTYLYAHYGKFIDCTITKQPVTALSAGFYAPYFPSASYGIQTRDGHHITVQDCNIYNCRNGIQIGASSSTVDDVFVSGNTLHALAGNGMVVTGCTNVIIEDNYCYDIDCRRTTVAIIGTQSAGAWTAGEVLNQADSGAVGVYDSNTSTRILAYITSEQEFAGTNTGEEPLENGTVTGATSNETLTAVGAIDPDHTDGIEVAAGGHDIIIRRNKVIRLLPGPYIQNGSTIKTGAEAADYQYNVTIENNLTVGGLTYITACMHTNININNNTFYGGSCIFYVTPTSAQNTIIDEFYNNIVSHLSLQNDGGVGDGYYSRILSHGNNIFGNTPATEDPCSYPFEVNEATEVVDASAWQDDLFRSVSGSDFTLAHDSNGIDAGTSDYGSDEDLLENARPNPTDDVGCYGYVRYLVALLRKGDFL